MRKSIAEVRADGKTSPKVGAVLVSPDGVILGSAHRGELREGDHAEFTLLERKHRDKNLTGCFLFVTLEPCANGARKKPKIECAQRIVNARIKKVWIGIEDPDPLVSRKGIEFLIGSKIEVEIFDKDLQDIIESENKQFLKEAIIRAEEAVIFKPKELTPMERIVESSSIDEFSKDALELYIQRSNLKMQYDSPEFLRVLEQQQLITIEISDENLADDEFRRNDVKPMFVIATIAGKATTIRNTGERAIILKYYEYPDNQSFVPAVPQGMIEKDGQWTLRVNSKTDHSYNNVYPGFHLDIIFQDKDGRKYKQEFKQNKGNINIEVGQPILINQNSINYIPTGLGILLFGITPRTRYPQAVLKAEARYGDTEPEIQDFDDALVLIPDKVEAWLKKVLNSKISRDNFARTTEYDFPIVVLREIIINALMHRDYDIEGAKCYLNIDDNKIILKSPGKPVSPIKFEDFKALNAPSLSRNPKLTAVFNVMNYMEERGIGMREMKSLPKDYNLPLPIITWDAPYITITFPRNQNYLESVIEPKVYSQLNEEERKGLMFIRELKEINKAQYRDHFGFNDKKAQRHLLKFKKLKLIKTLGQSTATKYYV
jgi:pyrimidine deaminase RibD-like protein